MEPEKLLLMAVIEQAVEDLKYSGLTRLDDVRSSVAFFESDLFHTYANYVGIDPDVALKALRKRIDAAKKGLEGRPGRNHSDVAERLRAIAEYA